MPAARRPVASVAARTAPRRSDPAYLLVAFAPSARGHVECRASLLTAGAKAAVLSGAVDFAGRELERAVAPLEKGTAALRDLAGIGTTLAGLLLPATVREGLETMRSHPLVVLHDRAASRVPWEVLRIGQGHPALLAGASRRYASDTLTVARWREDGAGSQKLRLLLVVNPTEDLPGAAAEGNALATLLTERGVIFDVLEGAAATRERILAALGAATYDVLHFAGHAFFDPRRPGYAVGSCATARRFCAAPISTVSVTCRRWCSAMRAKPHECAGRRARARHAGRLQPGNPACAARQALQKLSSAAGSRISSARTGRSKTPRRSRFRAPSTMRLLLAPRWEMPCSGRAARWRQLRSIDWADYVHYGSPDFRLTSHRAPSAESG